MRLILLIKSNLIKQVRNRSFLLILLISIFLGWLCVPDINDGYEICIIGGVRGIYNSAWLGTIASMLSTILLWLPGFYLLRSQISEDSQLKIGQIVAATPVTKLQYITGKVLSNFIILCMLESLFIVSFMVMQIIRGESNYISFLDYILPFLIVTVPYLLVLATLTILFDVIPILKGTIGNLLIFVFWVTMTSISVAIPDSLLDLFSIGKFLTAMTNDARKVFPYIPAESGNFGFYPHTEPIPTFVWDGISWNSEFLFSRFIWIFVAILLCILATMVFDRFKKSNLEKLVQKNNPIQTIQSRKSITFQTIPTVNQTRAVPIFSLLKGEIRILTSGLSKWWFLIFVIAFVLSWVLPLKQTKWGSLILLIPIPLWSQIGCDKKQYFTKELLISSGHQKTKWWVSWIVGVFISLLLSTGIIVRYILVGELSHSLAWIVGALFIPTLAIVLGSLSESRHLFEAVFIIWFYLGCINNIGLLDFLGIVIDNKLFYSVLIVLSLLLGHYFVA